MSQARQPGVDRPAPARRGAVLAVVTAIAALVAYWFVLPRESATGAFTFGPPAYAIIRIALLVEFLRCSYLGLDGRSPSRVTSAAPGTTATAFAERVTLVVVGSFAGVVAVSAIDAIPLGFWGLAGATAVTAATAGAFHLFGSGLRLLSARIRSWGKSILSFVVLSAILTLIWNLATGSGTSRPGEMLDTLIHGRIWQYFPPVRWVEHTIRTYAEFDRMLPPTYVPFVALGGAALVYAALLGWDRSRR